MSVQFAPILHTSEVLGMRKKVHRLTPGAIAAMFGVHRNTVLKWRKTGRIEYTAESVGEFIREQTDWRGRLRKR